ncbi:MAG: group III truncated hemoglobin [Sulfurovum sp.]|nr:group III truncated hemoglobin [Sulfurovum sp.]
MKADKISKENIRVFVMSFYAKLLQDEIVGPFFIAKLGEDIHSEQWKTHLEVIVGFWISLALGKPRYTGSLFVPHTKLGNVKRETFEQWLNLFRISLDEVYISPIAEKFEERAIIIAGNFMRNLGL